jgi:hypothetical protein
MLEGIKKARVGDKVIMELMYDKKGNLRFAAADVKRINRCRPKHWHTYATQREHTSGNNAWNYNQREEPNQRAVAKTNTTRTMHRRIWKRFLRELCNENRLLLSPLRKWISTPRITWKAYYDNQRHKAITTEDFKEWHE